MLIPSLFLPKKRNSEHLSSKSMGMLIVLINYLVFKVNGHAYAVN